MADVVKLFLVIIADVEKDTFTEDTNAGPGEINENYYDRRLTSASLKVSIFYSRRNKMWLATELPKCQTRFSFYI